jgi:hypothetical protein
MADAENRRQDTGDERKENDPGPIEMSPFGSISVEFDPGPIELEDVVYAPPEEDPVESGDR